LLTEGEIFRKLAEANKEAEGCCRQAAHWRGDTRYLALAALYAQIHQKALELQTRKTGKPGTLILPEWAKEWRERA
jgi:hypothetical protein